MSYGDLHVEVWANPEDGHELILVRVEGVRRDEFMNRATKKLKEMGMVLDRPFLNGTFIEVPDNVQTDDSIGLQLFFFDLRNGIEPIFTPGRRRIHSS